jgi:hypothetical protein
VAGGSGGFALVEAGGFARFGPQAGAVAGRAGNSPEAAAFGAFLECQFLLRLGALGSTKLVVAVRAES